MMSKRNTRITKPEMSSNKNNTMDTSVSFSTDTGTATETKEDATRDMDDVDQSVEKRGSGNGSCRESRRVKQENTRAVRVLTLVFAVFVASGIPWVIIVVIFRICPTCIPLSLYQVGGIGIYSFILNYSITLISTLVSLKT